MQFMLCKALNGLNPSCVRARLPPDDFCPVQPPAHSSRVPGLSTGPSQGRDWGRAGLSSQLSV